MRVCVAQAVWLAAWPPRYMSTRHTMGGEQEVTTRVITDMPSRYLASQELKVRTHVREPSGTMEEILDVQALLSSAEDPRCPGASQLCTGSQVSRHFSGLQRIPGVQALLSSAEDPRCPGTSRLCRGSQVSRRFSALQRIPGVPALLGSAEDPRCPGTSQLYRFMPRKPSLYFIHPEFPTPFMDCGKVVTSLKKHLPDILKILMKFT